MHPAHSTTKGVGKQPQPPLGPDPWTPPSPHVRNQLSSLSGNKPNNLLLVLAPSGDTRSPSKDFPWFLACYQFLVIQFSSVAQSCLTLCDVMDRSMPGLPVHHWLLESTQTRVQKASDAIQPSHLLSSPSPPALNLSQHQGLFQWVSSSHQVAKVLKFQLQHQSFQWTPRTDLFQDLLAVQGTLKSLLQHHSSKPSILWHTALFIVQLSHPYMTTGKTIGKVMSLLFNMLSRLVITFLPRSKHLLISLLQSPFLVIKEGQKPWSVTVPLFLHLIKRISNDNSKLWKTLKEMGIPDHLTCLLRNLYAGQEAQSELDMEQQTGSK